MLDESLRARVFISCGQSKDSGEIQTAHEIFEKLTQLGYDPYIAVEEQTLLGVKENIFRQIEASEYFVFIDFKRERLAPNSGACVLPAWGTKAIYRGSLFSHQELAVASYLNIPWIAFSEDGVKQQDGLLRFLQGNSQPFTDRDSLPSQVVKTIQCKGWDPLWKNQITLFRETQQFTDATRQPPNAKARFFHVEVKNLHRYKAAINCRVYLDEIRNIKNDENIPLQVVEFKWAGYTLPDAVIRPGSRRRFDAFYVLHQDPTRLEFNLFTDSTEFIPRIPGPGDFKMSYAVISENFQVARGAFALHVGNNLEEITFSMLTPD